jgi:hypothetical protein
MTRVDTERRTVKSIIEETRIRFSRKRFDAGSGTRMIDTANTFRVADHEPV